ncbi:hypothetical protein JCM10207_008504 [Rhodosporidiobolus poonsookiae]
MSFALDHIIVLVPHAVLHSLPAALTDAFTVTPGGQHADGLTENKLIILRDGAYLELIAFMPGADRSSHWWGAKQNGTMDFALTSPSLPSSFPAAFDPPQAGSRVRPDGEKVEWFVTFPKKAFERGSVPFFCHDRTPRQLRVPTDEAKTTHPSGAVGVAQLTVRVPAAGWDEAVKVYEEVTGEKAAVEGDAAVFHLGTVSGGGATSTIKVVKHDDERVDFGEIVVRTEGGKKPANVEVDLEGRPFKIRFE